MLDCQSVNHLFFIQVTSTVRSRQHLWRNKRHKWQPLWRRTDENKQGWSLWSSDSFCCVFNYVNIGEKGVTSQLIGFIDIYRFIACYFITMVVPICNLYCNSEFLEHGTFT